MMEKNLSSKREVGLLLGLALSLIYILLTVFQGRYIAALFLAFPIPGIAGFFYGNWSGQGWLSFLIGFLPVSLYFILALSPEALGVIFFSFLIGFFSGIIAYGGARKNKGSMDWILLVLVGAFTWILIVTPGIRS